jgi:hypothetical protein
MNKYHNKKTEVSGNVCDSMAEANRYNQLKLLIYSGEISDLVFHPRYCIIDGYEYQGKKIRPTYYEADFQYFDNDGMQVTEDVKGFATKDYLLKKKLFLSRYPYIRFVEIPV